MISLEIQEQPKRKLTAIEQRSEALYTYPDLCTIPSVCIDFRQSLNGAADPWGYEETQQTIYFLKVCLDTWHPSDDVFDSLVHQMIVETLRFAKAEILDEDAWSPDDDWIELEETKVQTK